MALQQKKASISTTYEEWVEKRMQSFVDKHFVDAAALTKTAVAKSSTETRDLFRSAQQQAAFRLPMQRELADHMKCKAAASTSLLTVGGMESSTPPGRIACWAPKIKIMAPPAKDQAPEGAAEGPTGTAIERADPCLEFFSSTDVPRGFRIENEEGLRKAVQTRGALSANWRKVSDSMIQDALLVMCVGISRKLQLKTVPLEMFRKIASYLDPVGDVLLSAAYFCDLAASARMEDIRVSVLDKSLSVFAEDLAKDGRSHQADLFFSVRMPSDRHCESAPVFLLRKADHVVSWDTERVTKWGLVGHDRLFRSRVWRAVGEYERMQRQTATAAPDRDADHHGPARVVRAVRANSWESVQTRFMAESVARRYYESVHGLGFELFAWSDNAVEREARGDNAVEHDGSLGKFFFKVSWD